MRKYEQARVLGGGSSINGQLANRGAPTDFEIWEERGAKGWGWNDVLPYFKKVERDQDFDGPYHGKEGHIPVRRISPNTGPASPRRPPKAFKARGLDVPRGPERRVQGRLFPADAFEPNERRVSAAIGYLDRRNAPALEPRDLDRDAGRPSCCSRARAASASRRSVKGQPQEFRAQRGDPVAAAPSIRRHI